MVGPIIGGWIYSQFGYFWCYIVLAILVGCDMIFTWFIMPNSVNNNDNIEEKAFDEFKDELISINNETKPPE